MDEKLLEFFKGVTIDREDNARVHAKPNQAGYWRSVIDKYSSQAHFVYELLQNADDVGAKEAYFQLNKDSLIFYHNGDRHFSVTDPKTEKEDKAEGTLGDINSITAIGMSGKSDNESTIGKFGVGFKAVFSYTNTPHIYDKDFQFKIERYEVPILIDDDLSIHKNKEFTYFVFPFDKKDMPPEKAYEEIASKLENLTFPLLFLNNLNAIICEYDGKSVLYDRIVQEHKVLNKTDCELITVSETNGSVTDDDRLWLFTRHFTETLKYSVGFFLDETERIKPVDFGAFCYFPTKEHTGLKFIVHAPFLLTDSRENVKAGEEHNTKMVDLLAELAADSLLYLRDIGIEKGIQLIDESFFLKLLPIPELSNYSNAQVYDKDKLSFRPFAFKMRDILRKESIFPHAKDIGYSIASDAYWARAPKILETFNDSQLSVLVNNAQAHWIFPNSFWATIEQTNRSFYEYINDLIGVRNRISDTNLLSPYKSNLYKLVTEDNIEWLHSLYSLLDNRNENREASKTEPLFLDQEGRPSAIFDDSDNEVLFLPSEISQLKSIHPDLLQNEDTKKFLMKLGISEPSVLDQIRDGLLDKYNDENYFDENDFNLLYESSKKLTNTQLDSLVDLITDSGFLIKSTDVDGNEDAFKPWYLYFRTDSLVKYFRGFSDQCFVHESLLSEDCEGKIEFLKRIGVGQVPFVYTHEISKHEAIQPINGWKNHNSKIWEEWYIEGCDNCLENIIGNKDLNLSNILWNYLINIIERNDNKSLSNIIFGSYFFRRYNGTKELDCKFVARDYENLRTKKWIFTNKSIMHAPTEITIDDLPRTYRTDTLAAQVLIKSLGIADSKFTADENITFKLGEKAREYNLSPDELEQILADHFKENQEKDKHQDRNENKHTDTPENSISNPDSRTLDPFYEKLEKKRKALEHQKTVDTEPVDTDEDEFIKPTVDTKAKIEKKERELALEINSIQREAALTEEIAHSEKYSYAWVMNLLEKELLIETGGEQKEQRTLHAAFTKVELEEGTERTLILKNPIGKIPAGIEEVSDVPLTLTFEDESSIDVIVEAFNVHSYSVRAKSSIREKEKIQSINFRDVIEAEVDFKQASFLHAELLARYKELQLYKTYSFQQQLTENIQFVFGPPGTGKTTFLVKNEILKRMQEKDNCKMLVLGPTNKSADVVVNRIFEEDDDYEDWLIRFGTTQDETIDQSEIYKDKHVDIDEYDKCVFVTTIHRFWYDFCITGDGRHIKIRDIEWDFIIIDEASMIPLVHLLYPLYVQSPEMFIIAGDPFQIQPVIQSEEWKTENIYSIVHLNEFSDNPKTIPHPYKVHRLTTQYRSIPSIGRIYSDLTYEGVLKHYRSEDSQKQLVEGDYKFSNLNLIRYPVSKYESIYASKYLNRRSSYHVYSAILTYELTKYLIETNSNDTEDNLSIGVISPYRAQADIVEKLCRSIQIPKHISLQIDTIHGFQGDECDIMICLFNAPPGSNMGENKFINNLNIINVAVSRARDYLFVITPDENTRGFSNLTVLNSLISIMRNTYGFTEKDSHYIEDMIFDDPAYIEENSFSTAHQAVNIYDHPEKKYEIRAEEQAIDIQLHTYQYEMTGQLESEDTDTIQIVDNDEVLTDTREQLYNLLSRNGCMSISEISQEFGVEKSLVRRMLYKERHTAFEEKTPGKWSIKTESIAIPEEIEDIEGIIPDVKEETSIEETEKGEFSGSQQDLMVLAESIFKDRRRFIIIEKFENGLKVRLNNADYFDLDNHADANEVYITMKAKHLNSVHLPEELEYKYSASTRRFRFAVSYPKLQETFECLNKVKKIKSINDESLAQKLNASQE